MNEKLPEWVCCECDHDPKDEDGAVAHFQDTNHIVETAADAGLMFVYTVYRTDEHVRVGPFPAIWATRPEWDSVEWRELTQQALRHQPQRESVA